MYVIIELQAVQHPESVLKTEPHIRHPIGSTNQTVTWHHEWHTGYFAEFAQCTEKIKQVARRRCIPRGNTSLAGSIYLLRRTGDRALASGVVGPGLDTVTTTTSLLRLPPKREAHDDSSSRALSSSLLRRASIIPVGPNAEPAPHRFTDSACLR
jgi:hypothetical protein